MKHALAIAILLLTLGHAAAADCTVNTWRDAAPLPHPRTEVAAATDGRHIFITGGMSSNPRTDLLPIYRYDTATDRWSILTKLDAQLNHTGTVVLNDKLYIVGGYDATGAPIGRVRSVELTSGGVTELASLPTPRGALAVAVLDGRIHAIGGTTKGSVTTHEVYDPATNRWSEAAPMHVARNHLTAAAVDGRIYAFGAI